MPHLHDRALRLLCSILVAAAACTSSARGQILLDEFSDGVLWPGDWVSCSDDAETLSITERTGWLEFQSLAGLTSAPLESGVVGNWSLLSSSAFQLNVAFQFHGQQFPGTVAGAAVSDYTGLYAHVGSVANPACDVRFGLLVRLGMSIDQVSGLVQRRLQIFSNGQLRFEFVGINQTQLVQTVPEAEAGTVISVAHPSPRLGVIYRPLQAQAEVWLDSMKPVFVPLTLTAKSSVRIGGFVDGDYRPITGNKANLLWIALQFGEASISPRDLTPAKGLKEDRVDVAWAAMPGASKYTLYRDGVVIADNLTIPTHADLGVSPGVKYSYQVSAFYPNLNETSNLCPPQLGWRQLPAPTGVAASDGASADNVTVSWSPVAGATGYLLSRKVGSQAATQLSDLAGTSFVDTSAPPGAPCSYTVKAYLGEVVSVSSSADSGWRKTGAPTGLSAGDGASASGVQLNWTSTVGASKYRVKRSIDGGAFTQIAEVTATSYLDKTVPVATSATYKVASVGATGTGEGLESASDLGWRSPPAPLDVAASKGTNASGVEVSWKAVTGATGYRVFRGETLVGEFAGLATVDTDAAPGVVASYTVRSVCGQGVGVASAIATGWRGLLAPTGVAATDGSSSGSVGVVWSTVTGAVSYQVLRGTGATMSPIATVTGGAASSYSDTTAVPGTLYTYAVRGNGAVGTGAGASSATDTGWRMLAAPASVTATDGRPGDVQVSWGAVTGAVKYQVIRDGVDLVLLNAPARSHKDTSAVPGTIYDYAVKAVGGTGTGSSAASAANPGHRGLAAPTGVTAGDGASATEVAIGWTPVTGATGYQVFRSGTVAAIGTPATNAFSDATAVAGTKYTYTVRAMAAGVAASTASAGDSGWRSLAAPAGVSATDSDTSKINVTWDAVAQATGYFIYRGTSADALSKINNGRSITQTTFADLTATPGTTYFYAVAARCAAGECVRSASETGLRPSSLTGDDPMAGGMPTAGGARGGGSASGSGERPKAPADLGGLELYLWLVSQVPDAAVSCAQAMSPEVAERASADGETDATTPVTDPSDAAQGPAETEVGNAPSVPANFIDTNVDGEPDLCQLRAGDLDLSGIVDEGDLALLLTMIGTEPESGLGDLDGDGDIDVEDAAGLVARSN